MLFFVVFVLLKHGNNNIVMADDCNLLLLFSPSFFFPLVLPPFFSSRFLASPVAQLLGQSSKCYPTTPAPLPVTIREILQNIRIHHIGGNYQLEQSASWTEISAYDYELEHGNATYSLNSWLCEFQEDKCPKRWKGYKIYYTKFCPFVCIPTLSNLVSAHRPYAGVDLYFFWH